MLRILIFCFNLLNKINKILSLFDINCFSLNFILINFLEYINFESLNFNITENTDTKTENKQSIFYSKTFWCFAGVTLLFIIIIIANGGDGGGEGMLPLTDMEKAMIMQDVLESCKKKS